MLRVGGGGGGYGGGLRGGRGFGGRGWEGAVPGASWHGGVSHWWSQKPTKNENPSRCACEAGAEVCLSLGMGR